MGKLPTVLGLITCMLLLFFFESGQGETPKLTPPQERKFPEQAYPALQFVFVYLACMAKTPDFTEGVVKCFQPSDIFMLDHGGGEYEFLTNDTKLRLHDLRECLKIIPPTSHVKLQKKETRKCLKEHNFNILLKTALRELFSEDQVTRFKHFLECLSKHEDPVPDEYIKECIEQDSIVFEMLEKIAYLNMKRDRR